jgi:hypothetical protein
VAPSFPVSDLPADLREQLGALREGDEIALVEDGRVVGTVTASARVLVGQVRPVAGEPAPPPTTRPGVRFVATGVKLTEEVRSFLSTALGDGYARSETWPSRCVSWSRVTQGAR